MTIKTLIPCRPLALMVILTAPVVRAWGPGFEPMKGGCSRGAPLHARDDSREHEESFVIETYRSKLHNIFGTHHEESHDTFAFVRERADELASEAFAEGFGADFTEPCGEDCEECLIPEHWKTTSDVDVLDFLGIRRAEPLRRNADWD
jgi:hypothetical protein